MPLTVQDRAALVAYLRHQEKCHTLAAHLAGEHGSPAAVVAEQAEAEQLGHWADGLELEIQNRRLSAVDGPVQPLRAASPGDDSIVS